MPVSDTGSTRVNLPVTAAKPEEVIVSMDGEWMEHFAYNSHVDKNLLCGICGDPFLDPVETTECHHTFCHRCISRWVAQKSVCPYDQNMLTPDTVQRVTAAIVLKQLDDLEVQCNECGSVCVRKEGEQHLQRFHGSIASTPAPVSLSKVAKRKGKGKSNVNVSDDDDEPGSSEVSAQIAVNSTLNDSVASEVQSGSVLYEYFPGIYHKLPDFTRLTSNQSGLTQGIDLHGLLDKNVIKKSTNSVTDEMEDFAVRFTGEILIEKHGVYTFYSTSNDGSQIYINGSLVVDNDGMHYAQEKQGTVVLDPGYHFLAVHYFHRNGKLLEGIRQGPVLSVSYYCHSDSYWGFRQTLIEKKEIPLNVLRSGFKNEKAKDFKGKVNLSYGSDTEAGELASAMEQSEMTENQRLRESIARLQRELQRVKTERDMLSEQLNEIANNVGTSTPSSSTPTTHRESISVRTTGFMHAGRDELAELYFSTLGLLLKRSMECENSVMINDLWEKCQDHAIPINEWPQFFMNEFSRIR
eukprot:Clim_evm47s25 gene=Clim_evmTU47s25